MSDLVCRFSWNTEHLGTASGDHFQPICFHSFHGNQRTSAFCQLNLCHVRLRFKQPRSF
jgi:hypothetical protein